jgi:CheY-like chemotaxis protein
MKATVSIPTASRSGLLGMPRASHVLRRLVRMPDPRLTAPDPTRLLAPDTVNNISLIPLAETERLKVGAAVRVLHIDSDNGTASVLAALLSPEAQVRHAVSLSSAREMLRSDVFSLVVLDPLLVDGDGQMLLAEIGQTPLLVHANARPPWCTTKDQFLPKPWTSHRQLWLTIAGMLGIGSNLASGD